MGESKVIKVPTGKRVNQVSLASQEGMLNVMTAKRVRMVHQVLQVKTENQDVMENRARLVHQVNLVQQVQQAFKVQMEIVVLPESKAMKADMEIMALTANQASMVLLALQVYRVLLVKTVRRDAKVTKVTLA